jgi:hypothetical protein
MRQEPISLFTHKLTAKSLAHCDYTLLWRDKSRSTAGVPRLIYEARAHFFVWVLFAIVQQIVDAVCHAFFGRLRAFLSVWVRVVCG